MCIRDRPAAQPGTSRPPAGPSAGQTTGKAGKTPAGKQQGGRAGKVAASRGGKASSAKPKSWTTEAAEVASLYNT
eukprot:5172423-Pyramimonas_sp.AAC.1